MEAKCPSCGSETPERKDVPMIVREVYRKDGEPDPTEFNAMWPCGHKWHEEKTHEWWMGLPEKERERITRETDEMLEKMGCKRAEDGNWVFPALPPEDHQLT